MNTFNLQLRDAPKSISPIRFQELRGQVPPVDVRLRGALKMLKRWWGLEVLPPFTEAAEEPANDVVESYVDVEIDW